MSMRVFFVILIDIILLINTQIVVCPHRLDIIVYVRLLIDYILGVLRTFMR
jgi:hypothetical protein